MVAKNVHKQRTIRRQPMSDPGKQLSVVAYMLKHLNRDYSIELLASELQRIDIGCYHTNVSEL